MSSVSRLRRTSFSAAAPSYSVRIVRTGRETSGSSETGSRLLVAQTRDGQLVGVNLTVPVAEAAAALISLGYGDVLSRDAHAAVWGYTTLRFDYALVIHEKHFNRHDYMIWKSYGTVQPVFVLRAAGVPIDPGPPPHFGTRAYQDQAVEVIRGSSLLDPVSIDLARHGLRDDRQVA